MATEPLSRELAEFKGAALARLGSLESASASRVVTVVPDPISCPQGHTGVVCVQVLEQVSSSDAGVRRTTGGAYFCPRCGESFYSEGGHSWQPKKAADPHAAAGPAPPRGPRLKMRNPAEER